MTQSAFDAVSVRTPSLDPPIRRLLFIADAAVADVDQLPPGVLEIIDGAGDVFVLTPTLPGRLAWLADDVDSFRHVADERLDEVLGHMHAIGAHVTGAAHRGSLLTVIGDAIAEFAPDHILVALRSAAHANWQERRLDEHIEDRFDVPVTSYAVDLQGRTARADGPVVLCYDGSVDAANAIRRAGRLFPDRQALVVSVWQPVVGMGSVGFPDDGAGGIVDFVDLEREASNTARRTADEGAQIARLAHMTAHPLAVRADGPVWRAILDVADRNAAATIVLGSRGRSGLRSILLGSVSSAVLHHADRPTMVIRQSADGV